MNYFFLTIFYYFFLCLSLVHAEGNIFDEGYFMILTGKR